MKLSDAQGAVLHGMSRGEKLTRVALGGHRIDGDVVVHTNVVDALMSRGLIEPGKAKKDTSRPYKLTKEGRKVQKSL